MDAVISIDYFKSILPKGLSFNQARQWLIDNGIIGPKAKAGKNVRAPIIKIITVRTTGIIAKYQLSTVLQVVGTVVGEIRLCLMSWII